MHEPLIKYVLFDFDGVIMDTESQYSEFWKKQGEVYLHRGDFHEVIKGMTLNDIFSKYFSGMGAVQAAICEQLHHFERYMRYEFVPGAEDFIRALVSLNIPRVVVTSSTFEKMEYVFSKYPLLAAMFDKVLTAKDFNNSKPHPECYLMAMGLLSARPDETLIFEDSINGLIAAKGSGAYVGAVATTNSRDIVEPYANFIIDDFREMTPGAFVRFV